MPQDSRRHSTPRGGIRGASLVLLLPVLGACSGPRLPTPRPLVIHSGARLTVDAERMAEVDAWVTQAVETMREDPTFFIEGISEADVGYPWEATTLLPDTARIHLERTAPDSWTPYRIYAFLRLMSDHERIDEWLPDAADATGYALERAIVERVADTWLFGRAVWDTAPFRLLDELIYAREHGYLDAFLLTLRSEEFSAAREEWLAANPGRMAEYRDWFQETFAREPPGSGEE